MPRPRGKAKNATVGKGGKRKAPNTSKNIHGSNSGRVPPGLQGDIHGSGKKE